MIRTPINKKYRCKPHQSRESGFTLVEMIIAIVLLSILGTFVFQIVTTSLNTLIIMRTRKESGDDAVLSLDKISREVREAKTIISIGSSTLIFEKNVTASTDTNKVVKFILNTSTNRLRRQSATSEGSLPGDNTSGDVIAENVTIFNVSSQAGSGAGNRVVIELEFSSGSEWETKIYPRNYNL